MLEFVDQVLAKYDSMFCPTDWYSITNELHEAVQGQRLTTAEQEEYDSDFLAFHVVPRNEPDEKRTYFTLPQYEYAVGEQRAASPTVSKSNVALWRARAASSVSPVRRARYADLVWDLGRLAFAGDKREHQFARIAISAYLEIVAKGQLKDLINGNDLLDRALSIASSIGDATAVALVIDSIIERGERAPGQGYAGIWLHPIEALASNKHTSALQKHRLIIDLNKRFTKATEDVDKLSADITLPKILALYPKQTCLVDRQRILIAYAAMHRKAAETSPSMLAISFLLPAIELLEDNQLPDEADELRLYVEERGLQMKGEMKSIQTETTLDKAALDAQTDALISGLKFYPALYRMAWNVMPRMDAVRRHLAWAKTNTPLQFLVTTVSFGESGLPISSRSGTDDSEESHLSAHYGRTLPMSALFFKFGLDRVKLNYDFSADTLMDAFAGCTLIDSDRREIVREGLLAFEMGDYLKAIHVLVPQVEMMMRRLMRFLRLPISKGVRGNPGVTELKNMNDFFKDVRITETLNEDLRAFLRHLYVDKHGYNLRNDLCHGIAPQGVFNEQVAGLVLQSIILLTAIRIDNIYIPQEPTADAN